MVILYGRFCSWINHCDMSIHCEPRSGGEAISYIIYLLILFVLFA